MSGCYVHLPFCDRICPYCDFAVVELRGRRVRRYLDALRAEIERSPHPIEPISTIYLGGGTPSVHAPDDLARLLATIFETFAVEAGSIECTLEANPSRLDDDRLRAARAAGITRLSVGVQSLDDRELKTLGREHDAEQARDFVRAARAAGHRNVNLDLIAGVPGQSAGSFARTLDAALALEPEHLSIYGLTIEAGTPYAAWQRRDPSAFPDDDAVGELLEIARERLNGAGLHQYEISNFARPGFACAHNLGYWRQFDCVAFGMSASGYERGMRYRNTRDFDRYCAAIESGESARDYVERLADGRRMGEAAMLALRTVDGIVDADFRARFGVDSVAAFRRARKKCSAAGLLEVDARGARLTDRGRLLANSVCAEFLEPEMEIATST